MTDYASVQQVKDMLAGSWGANSNTGSGSTRDEILAALVTRCSRMFDQECGRSPNAFAPGTDVSRRYSGAGGAMLDLDEFDAIDSVVLWNNQAGTSTTAISTSDRTATAYAQPLPFGGPPYTQLFYLATWPADVYGIGNVVVTGDVSTPPSVTHAVAAWAAYELGRTRAGFQETAQQDEGTSVAYAKGMPIETRRVIDYYKARNPRAYRSTVGMAEIVLGGGRYDRWP